MTHQRRAGRTHAPRPRLTVAVALTAALTVLAACSSQGASSGGGGDTSGSSTVHTLTLANAVKVDTLDPGASPPVNESIWLDQVLWSRLVRPNGDATKILPALAKSWTISKNHLTYTFHLRAAKFSDGSPITAADVVYSLKRSRKNPKAWGFLITAVKSIKAKGTRTVVVTLSRPHTPLLADLAIYAFGVIPEQDVKAKGSKFFTHSPIVTSGPFYISSYDPTSEVVLKANKYFYGKKPRINTLKIQIIPNDNDRVLALRSGKVDIIENPPVSQRKQLASNPKLAVDYFNSTRVDMLLMNNKNKYLSNHKVRQAIRYALDLSKMNRLAYNNKAIVATSFMPYKMLYWDAQLKPWQHSIAKAKKLMTEAGYQNGFNLNLITVSGDTIEQAEAVTIQDALKKIGINVHISSYELLTAYDKEDAPGYEMGLRYWTNDIIDPDEVVSYMASPASASNLSKWKDPDVPRLAVAARKELSQKKRQQIYSRVQDIVYQKSPFLPLLYPPFSYAQGRWVHGFKASPLGTYRDSLLTTLTVDKH